MAAKKSVALCAGAAIVASLLAGCAGPAAHVKGPTDESVALEYRMTGDDPLRYRVTTSFDQRTEVRGESVDVSTGTDSEVAVRLVGQDPGGSRLSVTIDSMRVRVTAPGADIVPDVAGALGRSFEMVLSPLGQESGFQGSDTIQYELGAMGKRKAAAMFHSMFPNLADHPVRPGDTWTSRDTITEGAEGQELRIELESLNTLDGFEVVGGLECARIKAVYTGTITGSGRQGPAEWTTSGTTEGSSVWFFAPKDGVFVGDTTEGTAESVVVVRREDGQTMEVPTTSRTRIQIALVR